MNKKFSCDFDFMDPQRTDRSIDTKVNDCPHMAKLSFDRGQTTIRFMVDSPCLLNHVSCDKSYSSNQIKVMGSAMQTDDRARVASIELNSEDDEAIDFLQSDHTSYGRVRKKKLTIRPSYQGRTALAQLSLEYRDKQPQNEARVAVSVKASVKEEGFSWGPPGTQATSLTIALPGKSIEKRSHRQKKRVFFSYGWDPQNGEFISDSTEIPLEEPVKKVLEGLSDIQDEVEILHDKSVLKPGDYISRYINYPQDGEVDLLILFASQKYWQSWYCMLELTGMFRSLMQTTRDESSILIIEHPVSPIRTRSQIKEVQSYWESDTIEGDFPALLHGQNLDPKQVADDFRNTLKHIFRISADKLGNRRLWSRDKSDEIVTWVKEQVLGKLT
ncbi:hypothetical protein GC197_09805 [bacterium]|nr:hypothetical protein [bacterium]